MGIFQQIADAKHGLMLRRQAMRQRQEIVAEMRHQQNLDELEAIKMERKNYEVREQAAHSLAIEKEKLAQLKRNKIKGFFPGIKGGFGGLNKDNPFMRNK